LPKDYVKAGEVKLLTVEGVDLWRDSASSTAATAASAAARPNRHDSRHRKLASPPKLLPPASRERQRPRQPFFTLQ